MAVLESTWLRNLVIIVVNYGSGRLRRRFTANWFYSKVSWLWVEWNSADLAKWSICWINARGEVCRMLFRLYVCPTSCDNAIVVLVLNRLMRVLYYWSRLVVLLWRRSCSKSVNSMEYYISADLWRYEESTALVSASPLCTAKS